jgi:hypothetical protein
VRLIGWKDAPRGHGARLDLRAAPLWLRVLEATPFVDRFAYPLLVRRGLGYLTPHPGWPAEELEELRDGWKLDDPERVEPGSVAVLRTSE